MVLTVSVDLLQVILRVQESTKAKKVGPEPVCLPAQCDQPLRHIVQDPL